MGWVKMEVCFVCDECDAVAEMVGFTNAKTEEEGKEEGVGGRQTEANKQERKRVSEREEQSNIGECGFSKSVL
jgi:hypothetical protein